MVDPVTPVMIVEDQQAIAELLEEALSAVGFTSIRVAHADGAAQLARDARVGLVLLDVMLPDRSGWEVLDDLRSDDQTRGIPVIVISAVYGRAGLHSLPAGGPIHFAGKPFDITDLMETVSDMMHANPVQSTGPS